MATPAQIIANQANAQRSTGPRTEEGRQISSANARSHGLTSRSAVIPGEDPEEYALFHRAFADRYLPQNMIEQKMVTELVDLEWRLRRVSEVEAQLMNVEYRKLTTDADLLPLIQGLDSVSQVLAVAFRRLVESRVLPNLFHQEARLARRAEKLEKYLHGDARFFQPSVHVLTKSQQTEQHLEDPHNAAPENTTPANEKRKNEANSAAAQPGLREVLKQVPFVKPPEPGRNEPCRCGSGLKFKRCCLNKPQGGVCSSMAA